MPDYPGKERRRYPRERDRFTIAYCLAEPLPVNVNTNYDEYPAVAVDVSEGGMGLNIDRPLPIGTVVRVHFELVNDAAAHANRRRPFRMDARVCHCTMRGKELYFIGVRFTRISPEDRDFLAAYIKDLRLKQ